MKAIWSEIKLWYWRQKYSESMLDEMCYGRFTVLYPDNQKSRRMYYKNAKSYASLFGGQVLYDPKLTTNQ